jgi:hypothetical protein
MCLESDGTKDRIIARTATRERDAEPNPPKVVSDPPDSTLRHRVRAHCVLLTVDHAIGSPFIRTYNVGFWLFGWWDSSGNGGERVRTGMIPFRDLLAVMICTIVKAGMPGGETRYATLPSHDATPFRCD